MRVAFVGDGQARALAELFAQFVQRFTGDDAGFIPADRAPPQADLAFIAEADIVVDQVFAVAPAFRVATAGPQGRIVRFPQVAAPFLYPYGLAPHPRNAPHQRLPEGPYPEGCRHLLELMAARPDARQAVATWLAADFGAVLPLDRMYEDGMAAQRRRDFQTGFRCADIVAEQMRAEQCFHSIGRPAGPLMRHLATETFRRMRVDERLVARLPRLRDKWPRVIYEQPVHPSVARHFGVAYVTPETRYAWAGEGRFTTAEWARRFVDFEWNPALHEGRRLLRSGRAADAVAPLRAAGEQRASRAAALVLLGQALRESGALEQAISILREAAAAEPGDLGARAELARTLQRADRPKQALAAWAEAAALDPTLVEAQTERAALFRQLGRSDDAAAAARAALREDPDNPIVQARMSAVLRAAGQTAEADALLAQAQAAEWPGLKAELAAALAGASQPEQAVDPRPPGSPPADAGAVENAVRAHLKDGERHLRAGAPAAAEAAARAALELGPDNASAHTALAEALKAQGRSEAAIAAARAAADREPNVKRLVYLGHFAFRLGQPRESARAFCDAAALAPERGDILASLSHALTRCGHYGEAALVARGAARLRPGDADLHCHLGNLLLLTRDPIAAEAAYRAAAALAPDRRDPQAGIAEALAQQGQLNAAVAVLREAAAKLSDRGLSERMAALQLAAEAAAAPRDGAAAPPLEPALDNSVS